MTDHLHDRVVAAVGTHYLVEGEIGRGGMAVVYRALDLRLNRHVAIKVLPPELAFNADIRTRFLREAQTAAQLSHPHIVPIFTVDETDGVVYFVMALVHGESLGARLARKERMPIDEVRRLLTEVADALVYAHRRGVVHRDIKPDNILIDRANGRAMVTDFGIARAAAGESRLTVTGVAVGTPAYMSPEQALGEREIDGRSDIYSLGVVGYQMLVGEPPFKATNTPAMLVKHVSEVPRPVRQLRPDVPAPLAIAIERALAKRPEDRWPDASGFQDALNGVATSAPDASQGPNLLWLHQAAEARSPRPPDAEALLPRPAQLTPPVGLGRRDIREWTRYQRELSKEQFRQQMRERWRGGGGRTSPPPERTAADRVRSFRRQLASTAITIPTLMLVNVGITHGPPWFLIPAGFMTLQLLRRVGTLWADGVGPLDLFRTGADQRLDEQRERTSHPAITPGAPLDPAASLAAADVLDGPHGSIVRRAASDRATARDILSKLGPIEKEMIPDIAPTLDALTDRIAALASTLHRLDADVSGSNLDELEERITALAADAGTPDRERRLGLLQRQRTSLRDLLDRRGALANQLESASLALQNLKFDLLKLRSAGVGAALGDVTSATQEARALSRDIGHILEATDDVKRL